MATEETKKEQQTDEFIQRLPAVAKKLYLPCKKCDANRFFVVVAHKTEKSAKVQCEICKSNKTFTIKKARKKGASKRSKAPTAQQVWETLKGKFGIDGEAYGMRNTFEVNSVIDHKKFGLGYVIHAEAYKIEVAFEDGARFLVHNKQ
ncbi:MAG: hypothetical protein KDD50_05205 [Bdellovibrionales bacterium]|nr:hypothetical protein [Bdellovibrionales bacterium]